jgi:predicted RNase H-like nuclease (RuvC/YqgF family)
MLISSMGALLLASCGEDPDLKYRREAQSKRIVELDAKLASMQAAMREDVKETAKDVETSKQSADDAEAFLKEKEDELLKLEADLAAAEKSGQEYRRKYVVKDYKQGGKP